MTATRRPSWVRRLLAPAPAAPVRRPARRPLGCERLEDRVVPVTQIDYGGLRFLATTNFQVDQQGDYFADAGRVSIGYPPVGTEAFNPLVAVDFTQNPGDWTLFLYNQTDPTQFALAGAPLRLVAGAEVPILQPAADETSVVFDIPALLSSNGLAIDPKSADSKPFEVGKLDFTPSGIAFANPTAGTTADAQVALQGSVSFDKVPLLSEAGVSAAVDGTNHVIADHTGITVTGATVTKSWVLENVTVAGKIGVGYDKPSNTYSFTGGVQVSTNPDKAGKVMFQNVAAAVDLAVANGRLTKAGFTIGGKLATVFQVQGLTVSTAPNNPVSFQYQFANGAKPAAFTLSGGLQVQYTTAAGTTQSLAVALVSPSGGPGLVFTNGRLDSVDASVTADFTLLKAHVSTAPKLNFIYNRAAGQFEISGGLSLSVGDQTITAALPAADANTPAGLVLVDGKLKRLHLAVSGSFDLHGLKLTVGTAADPVVIDWDPADDSLDITGTLTADFSVFQTTLTLGGGATGTGDNHKGLSVVGGKFQVDGLAFDLAGAQHGPLGLKDLRLSYARDGDSYDLGVKVSVGLPGGYVVGGDFEVVAGRLHSIAFTGKRSPGIAVGDSGLFITEIDAKVTNIDNPSAIVVTGKVEVVFGETVSMLGKDVNLFHAEGLLTVDADELVLECDVQLGAYSDDGGATWQGVLGHADGKLNLNWHTQVYSLHVEADGVLGVFDIEGDLVFAAGRDIQLLAEADVVVPDWVPFIGGDKLGGFGFYFEHVFAHGDVPVSTTFAAWIDIEVIWTITVGFEVVIDAAGNSNWSLIGATQVTGFKQSVANPGPRTFTYTTDLAGLTPPGATTLLARVDWSKGAAAAPLDGPPRLRVRRTLNGTTTTFTEDQFAANGITVVADGRLTGSRSATLQIADPAATDPYHPLQGDYAILVDVQADANPFPNFPSRTASDRLTVEVTGHVPQPTFGPAVGPAPVGGSGPVVPVAPTGTFQVSVSGHADDDFVAKTKVSLYRVSSADPFRRPVLVQTVTATGTGGSGFSATFQVPIDGLSAVPYTLIAVVDDGHSPPVSSAPSAPFTPAFAVRGTVTNQNGTPLVGQPVFLDYDRDGARDDTEPHGLTGPDGYAFTAAFAAATGWVPVPVGTPFDVVVSVYGPGGYAPYTADQTVTFDGTNGVVTPYTLRAETGVSGVVYDDTDSNGNPAAGLPVAGAVAYLDANGNGVRDAGEPSAITDAGGGYHFPGLAAGNYTVRVDPTTVGRGVAAPAFAVPAGTPGTAAGPLAGQYTYGLSFTTERAVAVTSLGVFDDNGDGLTAPLTAVLYDADTRVELARLAFTPANPGTLVGGTRYLDLPSPIILRPGFNGMIAAYGFGVTADRAGVTAYLPEGSTVPWTSDGGGGRLTFGRLAPNPLNRFLPRVRVGGSYAITPNTYPAIPDSLEYFTGNPTPFAAGSFLYRDIPWAASPQSPTSYAVALDDSGYDLAEGKDLGLLPPTVFFGTVTGDPLVNGLPQPSAPQAGWAVGLLADRVAVAINAGGANGPGFVADGYTLDGQPATTTAQIDTSRVANAPGVAIYQDARVGANGGGLTYVIPGLNPGASYTVRLHFAEIKFQVAGQRKFNAAINGTQVLFDFDIVAAAGSPNTAYALDLPAIADGFGRITLGFTAGSADVPLVNAVQVLSPAAIAAAPKLSVDSGGNGGDGYVADQYVTGGTPNTNTSSWVDTNSRTLTPATVANYQTFRNSATANLGDGFTYTLPGFEAGRAYTVRLHFAECVYYTDDARRFNVDINGRRVLTEFSIHATAGYWFTAVTADFDTTADAQGRIVVEFTNGSAGTAQVNALQVFEPAGLVATASTDAQGSYALVGYGAGEYTVVESPPAGWQQLAPEYTTPTFAPTALAASGSGGVPLAGQNTDRLTAADFDGDGRTDVLVAGGGRAYILFNQPDGSFQTRDWGGNSGLLFNGPPGTLNTLAAVGDFDGDHRPDVAVVFSVLGVRGECFVYLNTGNPSNLFTVAPGFWQLPGLNAGEYFSQMAAADMNGDELDDLVLGTSTQYAASARMVYAENAAGTRPVTSYTLPDGQGRLSYQNAKPYAIQALSITDADADGDRDVVMLTVVYSDAGENLVYGQGNPTLAVAYRDGAGWHGPITGGVPSELRGVTGMAVAPPRPGQPPTLIATTPIYYTGNLGENPYNISSYSIFRDGGNGGLSQAEVDLPGLGQPNAPGPNLRLLSGPRLRDVNGDGLPDLVNLFAPTVATQAISIRINNGGSGTAMFDWADPVLLPLPASLTDWVGDFEVADFDGDGLADIFVPGTGVFSTASYQPGALFRNETPQARPGRSVYAAAGGAVTGLDFHSAQTPAAAAVHGQVFEDVARNGTRNTGDAAAAGAVVFADLNRNGRLDAGEPQATTTAAGHYVLPGLADGVYSVGMLPDADWSGVVGDFRGVTIVGGSVERADLGRARRLLGAVGPQAVRAGAALDVTVPRTAAAAGRRLVYTLEGGVPAGLTIDPAAGRMTWSPTAADAGTRTVTVRVRDPFEPLFTDTRTVTVDVTAPPVVPPAPPAPPAPLLAVGGGNGQVWAFAADGAPRLALTPFPGFTGEVRVAAGDVTGDGVADVVAGAGPGGGPHVKVFDGATGGLVTEFFAFEPAFTGGVFVAAGDVDGDGRAEVVAGAGAGGGPRVRAWAGADLRAGPAGRLATDFFAGDPADRGGVRVAVRPAAADTPAALVAGSGNSGRVTAYRMRPDPVGLFALDVVPLASGGVFVG